MQWGDGKQVHLQIMLKIDGWTELSLKRDVSAVVMLNAACHQLRFIATSIGCDRLDAIVLEGELDLLMIVVSHT